MEYQVYKVIFSNGVHFGNGSLGGAEYTFCAATLFSAPSQRAVRLGEETLDLLTE